MKQCQIPDCSEPMLARGWCSTHYARWRRLGDPRPDQPIEKHFVPLAERVEKFIDRGGPLGCWLWTGMKTNGGYGILKMPGGRNGFAHRLVYELMVAPIPRGLELDHLCRVRHCVNPQHLEPVTKRENQLRGISFSAVNARKTHCPQGHPYDGDNLYINAASGGRVCRICVNEAQLRYKQRKKNKAP